MFLSGVLRRAVGQVVAYKEVKNNGKILNRRSKNSSWSLMRVGSL